MSLKEYTITAYNVGTEHESNSDFGIKYDSFGFDWKVENPIISDRDHMYGAVNEFNSPFQT